MESSCYRVIPLLFRKNSKTVVDYLQKNYKEDTASVQGARLLCRALCEIVDNPRQNLELAIVNEKGVRFLTTDEINKLVASVEEEIKK